MNNFVPSDLVGEGSFAKVIKAHQNSTGNQVAIKIFKPIASDEDNEYMKKCVTREIATLQKVRNRNVVDLIDTFYQGTAGTLHMVFEYLPQTLLHVIEADKKAAREGRPQRLTQDTVVKLAFQLMCAVRACHAAGVAHRDIKPDNLLVDEQVSCMKLCDFGVAREVIGHSNVSKAALVHGDYDDNFTEYVSTRWYRSPELLFRNTEYTTKVDIWAAGCVVAEMILGEPLFAESSEYGQVTKMMEVLGRKFSAQVEEHFRHRCAGFKFAHQTTTLQDKLAEFAREPQQRPRFESDWVSDTLLPSFLNHVLSLDERQRPTANECVHTVVFSEELNRDPKCGRLTGKNACHSFMMVKQDREEEDVERKVFADLDQEETLEEDIDAMGGLTLHDSGDEEDHDAYVARGGSRRSVVATDSGRIRTSLETKRQGSGVICQSDIEEDEIVEEGEDDEVASLHDDDDGSVAEEIYSEDEFGQG